MGNLAFQYAVLLADLAGQDGAEDMRIDKFG